MRNGRALRDDEKEMIVALWEEGEPFAAIAAAIGRGHTTPQRYLCSVGLHQPPFTMPASGRQRGPAIARPQRLAFFCPFSALPHASPDS